MGKSRIEWLARPGTIPTSWNPVTGCSPISPGCKNCYAERMSKRLAGRAGYPAAPHNFDVTLHPDKLEEPLRWRKPRTVFVCSMSDLFHEALPVGDIEPIFRVIQATPQHTYFILTKRPERMDVAWGSLLFHHNGGYPHNPLPNVLLSVTIENQEMADKRIPVLLQIPAAVRFISVEPMLGPVNIPPSLWTHKEWESVGQDPDIAGARLVLSKGIDWVICGAETGPGKRPMKLEWARDLRDQCRDAGIPFFFKRDGDGNGTLCGQEYHEWPEVNNARS